MTIYVDFDDVIFKCNKRLVDFCNQDIKDWDITKYGLTTDIFSEHYFYVLDKNYIVDGFIENIHKLKELGDVKILTKFCKPVERGWKQLVIDWLGLSEIKLEYVKVKDNKQKYLKEGDFLIDDCIFNLKPNKNNILFDFQFGFNREWNKDEKNEFVKLTNWNDIYNYIKEVKNEI